MSHIPMVIGRNGAFELVEPEQPNYLINVTSLIGKVECSHTVYGSELHLQMEPDDARCFNLRCTVTLKNPARKQTQLVMEARVEGRFWKLIVPNYKQYVHENEMLIKYDFGYPNS